MPACPSVFRTYSSTYLDLKLWQQLEGLSMRTLQCGHVTRASLTPDALDPPGSRISRICFCLCPTFHVESALFSSASVGGEGATSNLGRREERKQKCHCKYAQGARTMLSKGWGEHNQSSCCTPLSPIRSSAARSVNRTGQNNAWCTPAAMQEVANTNTHTYHQALLIVGAKDLRQKPT